MSDLDPDPVPFDRLQQADLIVDAVYAGGTAGTTADDPIGKIVPVGNQGGFRYAGSPQRDTVRVAVLYTSGNNPDWPDELDVQTGQFVYYGDNRKPGHELHETSRKGNLLLRKCFEAAHGTAQERAAVPPFFLFEKNGGGSGGAFGSAVSSRPVVRASQPTKTWSRSGGAQGGRGFRTTGQCSLFLMRR